MSKYIHELLGYKFIKIVQDENMFKFSLDSIMLANAVDCKGAINIIDLCSGNCPIPLFLTLKTKAKIYGVEIQKEVYLLGDESIRLNNLENQIELLNDDLIGIYKKLGANKFDIVSCNPPYFKVDSFSYLNKTEYKTIARHEVLVTLLDVVIEAGKLLKDGGFFYLINRVSRFIETINYLEENNFGIRKITYIYSKKESDANMFIVVARKNRKTDVVISKPIYIYNDDNTYTDEVIEIFNFKERRT